MRSDMKYVSRFLYKFHTRKFHERINICNNEVMQKLTRKITRDKLRVFINDDNDDDDDSGRCIIVSTRLRVSII